MSIRPIQIFTDGASIPNPGAGGWAVLILANGTEQILTGNDPDTTNQRMELTAAIKALEALPVGTKAELYSDSKYVVLGITSWITGWRRKDWRTAAGKPVLNLDLWLTLDMLNMERDVLWRWLRGHNGNPNNTRVDELANAEAVKLSQELGLTEGARYGFAPVDA